MVAIFINNQKFKTPNYYQNTQTICNLNAIKETLTFCTDKRIFGSEVSMYKQLEATSKTICYMQQNVVQLFKVKVVAT